MSGNVLTGRRRFRVAPDGLVVLQVEERWEGGGGFYYDREPTWRDASVGDITIHTVKPPEARQDTESFLPRLGEA